MPATQEPELKAKIADFLTHCKARNLSPHSVHGYRIDLEYLADYLGQTPVSQINRKTIRSFIALLSELGASPATLRRRLACVKEFCTYLHSQGLIDAGLIRSIRGPRPHDTLPDVPSETDIRRLLEGTIPGSCPSRDRALLELLYGAGLRASEVVGIDLGDLVDDRFVRIHGKGNRDRYAVFGEPCQKAIAAWLPVRKRLLKKWGIKTDALFCSVSSHRSERLVVRNVNRIVARVAVANGLPKFNPHALRHACATHAHDHGMPLQAVSMMLGHANLDSTQVYTRTSTKRLTDVYRKAHPHARIA